MVQTWRWANLDGLGSSYGRYAEPSINSLDITPHEALILSHPCIILAGTLWLISSQFSVVKPAFRFLSRPALTTDSSTGSETQARDFGRYGRFLVWPGDTASPSSFIPLTVLTSWYFVVLQLAQEHIRETLDTMGGLWCWPWSRNYLPVARSSPAACSRTKFSVGESAQDILRIPPLKIKEPLEPQI